MTPVYEDTKKADLGDHVQSIDNQGEDQGTLRWMRLFPLAGQHPDRERVSWLVVAGAPRWGTKLWAGSSEENPAYLVEKEEQTSA